MLYYKYNKLTNKFMFKNNLKKVKQLKGKINRIKTIFKNEGEDAFTGIGAGMHWRLRENAIKTLKEIL